MSELVETLRKEVPETPTDRRDVLIDLTADELERLEAENQMLRDALSASVAGWNGKTKAR